VAGADLPVADAPREATAREAKEAPVSP